VAKDNNSGQASRYSPAGNHGVQVETRSADRLVLGAGRTQSCPRLSGKLEFIYSAA